MSVYTSEVSGGSASISNGERYLIAAVTTHPSYNPQTIDFDVAVVQIKGEFEFGPTQQMIPLPAVGEKISDGNMVTASGWGVSKVGLHVRRKYLLKKRTQIMDKNNPGKIKKYIVLKSKGKKTNPFSCFF